MREDGAYTSTPVCQGRDPNICHTVTEGPKGWQDMYKSFRSISPMIETNAPRFLSCETRMSGALSPCPTGERDRWKALHGTDVNGLALGYVKRETPMLAPSFHHSTLQHPSSQLYVLPAIMMGIVHPVGFCGSLQSAGLMTGVLTVDLFRDI